MAILYPRTYGVVPLPRHLELRLGEGLNAQPFEAEELLDFSGPVGRLSEAVYSFIFQLGKWGFQTYKIEESVEVSPVFQTYYNLTIQQKQALEQQIKAGLKSVSDAVSDLELLKHDYRKYREFMDYFTMIDKGNELIKKGKKEEGELLRKRGEQTLRSIFIDQVDAHTGEGIALRSIAPRWPTIIVDFMKLSDEDIEPGKIKDKKDLRGVTEAEGVVLATKNKLYIEWRDRLFRRTVEDRFRSLLGLVEARKKSVMEYKNMLKPIIARFLAMKETDRHALQKMSYWRPDAQAISVDFMILWAWRPFAPMEKYKITRESMDEISAKDAGFRKHEIKEIREKLKEEEKTRQLTLDEEMMKDLGKVAGLPVEPSIDNVIRTQIIGPIQNEHHVTITPMDVFKARSELVERFRSSRRGTATGESWVFSPYFNHLEFPMYRTVFHLPNGQEFEDLWIEFMTTSARSQNIIIGQYLELVARDKALDNYIDQMLGDKGAGEHEEVLSLEELMESEKYKTEEEKKSAEKKSKEKKPNLDITTPSYSLMFKVFDNIGKIFSFFIDKTVGEKVSFFASRGPYEFNMNHRIAKIIQPEPGLASKTMGDFFRGYFGVPGIKAV